MRFLHKTLTSAAVILALAGVVIAAHARDAEVGKPAPPIEARTIGGAPFSLAAQKGKVVVLNVWATWCGPCREEMPALDAYYKKYRSRGLEMLALSVDVAADLPKVRELMQAFSFPAALISDANVGGYGRMRAMPQTFVIDANGILRRDGFVDKGVVSEDLLERVVTPLLPVGAATAPTSNTGKAR